MEKRFYANVFTWLFVGLLLTFGTGFMFANFEPLLIFAIKNMFVFLIAQIVLCIVISLGIRKLSTAAAKAIYIGYALLTGATFSTIFLAFDMGFITYVFLITAIIFGIFALIGHTTKINLNSWGIYLFFPLLGLIILEILDWLVFKGTLDTGLCIVGIIIFVGYTAYDMQKIKLYAADGDENLAILGALELYLDFINIFIKLLRLLSKRRD